MYKLVAMLLRYLKRIKQKHKVSGHQQNG